MMAPTVRNMIKFVTVIVLILGIMGLSIGLFMGTDIITMSLVIGVLIGIGVIIPFIVWLAVRIYYHDKSLGRNKYKNVSTLSEQCLNIKYELTNDDIINFINQSYKEIRRVSKRIAFTSIIIEIFVLLIMIILFDERLIYLQYFVGILALLTLLWLVYLFLNKKEIQKTRLYNNLNNLVGKHDLTISYDNILETTKNTQSISKWNSISKIVLSNSYLVFIRHKLGPYIIPKSAFRDEQELEQFIDTAKVYCNNQNYKS
jgi:hypothetical protein